MINLPAEHLALDTKIKKLREQKWSPEQIALYLKADVAYVRSTLIDLGLMQYRLPKAARPVAPVVDQKLIDDIEVYGKDFPKSAQTIRQMLRHLSVSEVAAKLQMTYSEVYIFARKAGMISARTITVAQRREAVKLAKQVGEAAAARQLGFSPATVSRWASTPKFA